MTTSRVVARALPSALLFWLSLNALAALPYLIDPGSRFYLRLLLTDLEGILGVAALEALLVLFVWLRHTRIRKSQRAT